MKKVILISLGILFLSLQSFAQGVDPSRITYVDGSGNASGFCRSNDYFCPKDIHDRAERDGTNQAQNRCYLNQGTPLQYTVSCNTYCSPAYIPPNSNSWVTCNSTCRMQCDVKN